MTPQAAALDRLRANRVPPPRDLRLTSLLDSEMRRVRPAHRAASSAVSAWDELLGRAGMPPGLLTRTRVVSFRNGVLTVRAADASTKYAVDRFLRAGGEAALARLASTTLRRVKLVL